MNIKKTGFTMIEMLIVMAIIGMLLSLVSPHYFKSLQHAKETALRHDLSEIREAIGHFYGDRNRYPENLNELVQQRYLKAIPIDPITETSETWLAVASPDPTQNGMYDILSGAEGAASDGTPYNNL
ncbi:MAG: prepilin-type N-terminal cleavage/methylation domain-containing protein [Methylovulum sp.]|nr:prepilin-type N-terminal cleavage/methylation domain-containing protein [Methylovulum sp.]